MKITIEHDDLYYFTFDIKDFNTNERFYINYESIRDAMTILDIKKTSMIVDYLYEDMMNYEYNNIIKQIMNCLIIIGIEYKYNNQDSLYFLQNDCGLIKIGKSNNVERRIRELELFTGSKIRLIKKIEKSSYYEKLLHKIFKNDNIIYKSQTEWFFPSLKLIYLISILDEKNINELCLTR